MEGLPVTSYVKRRAGTVSSAYVDWGRSYQYQGPSRGRSAAQNAGLRYEIKVCERLVEEWEGFLPQVVLKFTSDFISEKCIADGLLLWHPLLRAGEIVVVEVKLKHTADAWFSLKYLYQPVVARAFPRQRVRRLEICRSYESGVRLPESHTLHRSVDEFLASRDAFGVVCWRL